MVFPLPGALLFQLFGIVAFSKGYVQVFKSARSGVIIQLYFYDCVSLSVLLTCNKSSLFASLKEESRLPLPCPNLCPFCLTAPVDGLI